MEKRVGMVGTGLMGGGMAKTLLRAGFAVNVFDVDQARMTSVVEAGANGMDSLPRLVKAQPVVLMSLPGPAQVAEVMEQVIEIWHGIGRPGIVIDFSTIDPVSAIKMADKAKVAGGHYLEAPVSGGPGGAANGTLAIMVAGNEAVVQDMRPVLDVVGQNVYYLGSNGTAQLVKLCNNVVVATITAVMAEAYVLASKGGVSPGTLAEILAKSAGGSKALEIFSPHVISGEYSPPTFALGLMLKDLGLYVETCKAYDVPTVLGALTHQLYRMGGIQGLSGLDQSAITQVLEKMGTSPISR